MEPEATSQRFLVYGVQANGQGVIIYVDFSDLHEYVPVQPGHSGREVQLNS